MIPYVLSWVLYGFLPGDGFFSSKSGSLPMDSRLHFHTCIPCCRPVRLSSVDGGGVGGAARRQRDGQACVVVTTPICCAGSDAVPGGGCAGRRHCITALRRGGRWQDCRVSQSPASLPPCLPALLPHELPHDLPRSLMTSLPHDTPLPLRDLVWAGVARTEPLLLGSTRANKVRRVGTVAAFAWLERTHARAPVSKCSLVFICLRVLAQVRSHAFLLPLGAEIRAVRDGHELITNDCNTGTIWASSIGYRSGRRRRKLRPLSRPVWCAVADCVKSGYWFHGAQHLDQLNCTKNGSRQFSSSMPRAMEPSTRNCNLDPKPPSRHLAPEKHDIAAAAVG